MVGALSPDWIQRIDSITPMHASALCQGLRCGIISNKLHTPRKDSLNDAFSLSWVLTGSGSFACGSQLFPLQSGCVILRKPGFSSVLALDAHATQRRCFLHLDGPLYPLLCYLLPEIDRLPAYMERPIEEGLLEEFTAFVEAVDASDERSPLPFLGRLRRLLCLLLNLRDEEADAQIMLAASLLISMPPDTPLPEIAERCGISYGQFRKRFTQVYGDTPGQWRIQQRVIKAQQALASGESIQKVASRLGYADVYTLTHQFKDVSNTTPKTYQLSHID